MKKVFLMLAALLTFAANTNATGALDLKEVIGGKYSPERLRTVTPLPDGESYAQISSDGKRVEQYSYKTGKVSGVLFDVGQTKGESISDFDDYIMSPDGRKMLIQTNTERVYRRSFRATYYIYNVATKHMDRLSDGGPQQSPVWDNLGTQVAFVRDNNIHLVKLLYDNSESQVTKDGKKNEIINGIPDWVYEEEFGFNCALTFNADCTMLCWVRWDETAVPEYQLQYYKGSAPAMQENSLYPHLFSYKYPKAGERNATVSVHSFDIKSRQTRTLDVPLPADGYIPRIMATGNAENIIVYTMNRHQDELCLYGVNPRSTVARLLIKEQVDKYMKEEAMENIQIGEGHILLPSDRDGKMQLYLYTLTGQLQKKFNTPGEVTEVYGYDEANGNLYYQAIGKNALNREVYATLKNGKYQLLTPREGWNDAIFSKNFKYFIHQWSDANTPYEFETCNAEGKQQSALIGNNALKGLLANQNLGKKEFFTFKTSENVSLNGVIIKPHDFSPSKKYPVIMWQYSGPGSQQVKNAWGMGSMGNGALYDQWLADQGFIIVCVDGRGTGGRGADFEKCVYKNLGVLEAKDQVETALWLAKQPYVDSRHIGIWGWSYGGFCTLMSMSEGRPVFYAGVAVAPPTDWRFYDSIYTERYMRTPQENAAGYAENPITRAPQLNGALLVCHGMADDNVHPQNTFEYTEALVQADKDFKTNLYTNRNHSIYGGNTRVHLLRQIAQHFINNLK